MSLFGDPRALERLVTSTLAAEGGIGPVSFGTHAPAGPKSLLALGAVLVDAVLSAGSGASPNELTSGGVAITTSRSGLWIMGASRDAAFLQAPRWVLRTAPRVIPWAEVGARVRVEKPNSQQVFLTFVTTAEPGDRFLFWDGVGGLPHNHAFALAIVGSLGIE